MVLRFKTKIQEHAFPKLDDRLQFIMLALVGFVSWMFDKDVLVTSVYRNQEGSVHKYYRGVDFRICPKKGDPIYTDSEIKQIEDFLSLVVYGNDKQTLLIHDAGSGLHGHVQVNNGFNTTLRKTHG